MAVRMDAVLADFITAALHGCLKAHAVLQLTPVLATSQPKGEVAVLLVVVKVLVVAVTALVFVAVVAEVLTGNSEFVELKAMETLEVEFGWEAEGVVEPEAVPAVTVAAVVGEEAARVVLGFAVEVKSLTGIRHAVALQQQSR